MQNIFNIATKSIGMHKGIRGRKIHCYHLAKNISSSLLSKIIKMISVCCFMWVYNFERIIQADGV
jgi:flagellar biosynthesis protein FliR